MSGKGKLKNLLKVGVIIGALIIPLMYSYLYLGAFWDPYSRLDKVPVAIVNSDQGAEVNGSTRNLGDELCDRLKENGSLKFDFVDEKTARNGVKGTKYYAALIVPTDFSENIASVQSDKKTQGTIKYIVNEKRNYLASQILNSAIAKIEKEITSNVDGAITLTLANKLREVPKSLDELDQGLGKLYTGSLQLQSGGDKLSSGVGTLTSGIDKLDNGAAALKSGSTKLSNGTEALTAGTSKLAKGSNKINAGAAKLDKGMDKLLAGIKKINKNTKNITDLKTGAEALDAGVNGDGTAAPATAAGLQKNLKYYTDSVGAASTGVSKVYAALQQFEKGAGLNVQQQQTLHVIIEGMGSGASRQAGLYDVKSGLEQLTPLGAALNTGATQLSAGTQQLAAGVKDVPELKQGLLELQSGIATAKKGSAKLASGSDTLASGNSELASSSVTLNNGAAALASGTNTLKNGTSAMEAGKGTLTSGVSQLTGGIDQLTGGLKTAKDGVSSSVDSAGKQVTALNGVDDYAKTPVNMNKDEVEAVPNYGTAFAPYFLSLSLWVGGLIIFFGIYFDVDRRFKYLCRDSANVVVRSFAYLGLGLAQALVLAFVVKFALGLEVQDMTAYVASCCLVSVVFISIIQFCLVHMKDIGKFVAIFLLILQLTSCGGTFPIETVPSFFRALYPYMPMTYSVNLFKETISGVTGGRMATNILILIAIMVGTLIATILLSVMKKGARELRKMKRAQAHGDA